MDASLGIYCQRSKVTNNTVIAASNSTYAALGYENTSPWNAFRSYAFSNKADEGFVDNHIWTSKQRQFNVGVLMGANSIWVATAEANDPAFKTFNYIGDRPHATGGNVATNSNKLLPLRTQFPILVDGMEGLGKLTWRPRIANNTFADPSLVYDSRAWYGTPGYDAECAANARGFWPMALTNRTPIAVNPLTPLRGREAFTVNNVEGNEANVNLTRLQAKVDVFGAQDVIPVKVWLPRSPAAQPCFFGVNLF